MLLALLLRVSDAARRPTNVAPKQAVAEPQAVSA
jgi:hypothetical protein